MLRAHNYLLLTLSVTGCSSSELLPVDASPPAEQLAIAPAANKVETTQAEATPFDLTRPVWLSDVTDYKGRPAVILNAYHEYASAHGPILVVARGDSLHLERAASVRGPSIGESVTTYSRSGSTCTDTVERVFARGRIHLIETNPDEMSRQELWDLTEAHGGVQFLAVLSSKRCVGALLAHDATETSVAPIAHAPALASAKLISLVEAERRQLPSSKALTAAYRSHSPQVDGEWDAEAVRIAHQYSVGGRTLVSLSVNVEGYCGNWSADQVSLWEISDEQGERPTVRLLHEEEGALDPDLFFIDDDGAVRFASAKEVEIPSDYSGCRC